MSKKIIKLFSQINYLYNRVYKLELQLKKEVQKVCDFEINITYCQGDGVLILDPATANVFTFDALDNKTKKNKLSYEKIDKYGI